jgi:hypothetical protein
MAVGNERTAGKVAIIKAASADRVLVMAKPFAGQGAKGPRSGRA